MLASRRSNLFLILGLVLLFIIIAMAMVTNHIYPFDTAITAFVQSFTNHQVTAAMQFITLWGNTSMFYILAPLLAIILYLLRRPLGEPSLLIASTLGSSVFVATMKRIAQRPRPDLEQLVAAHGFSFPSGHAMISLAFYGAVAYLLYRYWQSSDRLSIFPSWLIPTSFGLLILFIGISRIYLGVHYPSDVLAGFAAGGAWLALCAQLILPAPGKDNHTK